MPHSNCLADGMHNGVRHPTGIRVTGHRHPDPDVVGTLTSWDEENCMPFITPDGDTLPIRWYPCQVTPIETGPADD